VDTRGLERPLYDSVSERELTCVECGEKWWWPWPYDSKKPLQPRNCPNCRNKEIARLNMIIEYLEKQADLLKRSIYGLKPDPRERML
jgi:hypothetical protein